MDISNSYPENPLNAMTTNAEISLFLSILSIENKIENWEMVNTMSDFNWIKRKNIKTLQIAFGDKI